MRHRIFQWDLRANRSVKKTNVCICAQNCTASLFSVVNAHWHSSHLMKQQTCLPGERNHRTKYFFRCKRYIILSGTNTTKFRPKHVTYTKPSISTSFRPVLIPIWVEKYLRLPMEIVISTPKFQFPKTQPELKFNIHENWKISTKNENGICNSHVYPTACQLWYYITDHHWIQQEWNFKVPLAKV